MNPSTALVITSINPPNRAMAMFADGAGQRGIKFLVIGDTKSPASFELAGCDFHSVERQLQSGLGFAEKCPTRHYARKNIGYLLAANSGAEIILDTDDDNFPRDSFWDARTETVEAALYQQSGWMNAYKYFSDALIWPRGLPLDTIHNPLPPWDSLSRGSVRCPIQQGLADENPDVDAIYRLLLPLPQNFRADRALALTGDSWCPFNSQNTTWFRPAFPLLYLPAYCSFRMTDIWRSFVAQRIARENGWGVLFHRPTVWQERNEHNLMRDFADEVSGYLTNDKIKTVLDSLKLAPGEVAIPGNLRACYGALVEMGAVGVGELELLDFWLADLA